MSMLTRTGATVLFSTLAIGAVDLALAQQGECYRADILAYRARA